MKKTTHLGEKTGYRVYKILKKLEILNKFKQKEAKKIIFLIKV